MKWKIQIKPVLIFVIMSLLILVGFSFLKVSHKVNKEVSVNFVEKSNIDYKVYLKENSFFEVPYLEKNRTYIASLIDYILINFDYSFNVDNNIKGSYSYYIKGTVKANKSNSEDYYWSKDYLLSEKITKNYSDATNINIQSDIKVNYQLYNSLLNEFKSNYGLTMDGVLTVSLVIENNIKSDLVDREIAKESNIELNIPLTMLTIEVPIEANDLYDSGTLISETVKQNVSFYTVIKYLGYCSLVIASLLFIYIMYLVFVESRKTDKYAKELKKILKTYDNIIVNTKMLPNLQALSVIYVTSFDELIDAHSEVRKPINYIQQENQAIFILINEGMAWVYVINKQLKLEGIK